MAVAPLVGAGAVLLEGGEAAAGIAAAGAAAGEATTALGALRAALGGAEGGFGKLLGKVFSLETGLSALKKGFDLAVEAIKKVVDFLVTATLAFADFDEKMDALQASSGGTSHEMEVLGDRARELASSMGFDVSQVVEGLQGLADAGLNADEQMKALVPTLQLAQTTGKSVGDSVGLMTETLQKFHLDVGQSAEVADTFAAALRQTALSAPDLATIMGKLSDNAVRSGQSLQGSLASISVLKDVFGDTETAATSFEGMLSTLKEKSGELGVQVTDSSGKLLPMVDILRNMEKVGFDAAKAGEVLGKEAGPTLAALLGVGSDALARLQTEMKGTGQGAEAAKEATNSLRNDLKELKAAGQGIMQSIGAALEPVARAAVQFVTRIATAVREFIEEHSEAGKFLGNLFANVVGVVGKVVEKVFKFLAPIKAVGEGLKAIGAISEMVSSGWMLLAAKGYELFGKLTKSITDNVAKALGAVKSLLEWISRISEIPGVSKIPGLSGLTEGIGKKAGEWARSIGELQAKVQKSGDELAGNFQDKALQALADYIKKTAKATQATSAFQQALRNYRASEDDVAAALAAAGKEKPDKKGGTSTLVGVNTNVGLGVNVGVNVPPPAVPPSYHEEIQRALSEAESSAAAVQKAFDVLRQSPLRDVAQGYEAFQTTAQRATERINQQKEALKALGLEKEGVAEAIAALDAALKAIADQSLAADSLKRIADGFASIQTAESEASAALGALDAAPLSEVLQRTEDVDRAMATLDKAIGDQVSRLSDLTGGTNEYADAQAELQEALAARAKLEDKRAEVMADVSQGTRDALKALKEYSAAESAALKVEKLTAYLAAVEKIKTEIATLKELMGKLDPASDAFATAKTRLGELEGQLGEVKKQAEAEGIKPRTDGFDDSIGEMAKRWDKFVNDAVNSFGDLFLNVLEGNVDNFGDFIDSIKKMFRKMIAEMAADSLKKVLKIPVTFGGEGGTIGSGGKAGKYVGLDAFKDPATGKYDWGRLFGTAAMGLGVGSLVGSFLGKEDNYAELGSQILGVVGAIVGAYFGSPQVGAWIGSIVGGLIGSLIKKGLPSTSATLSVSDGRAQVDAFFSRNKGNLDQIRQYAEGVVKGINDLAKLTDATLLDLPDIKISIKNNKFFRVIDQSGFVKSFGEDYEAAVNYAILLALKGASFSGLSPEVEAALRNTKATTVEELASDIEFAKEVRDIDLEPVTKDLRDVIRRFNEMRERARDLGISLDKVDSAFTKAVKAIKDDILSGLKPFQEAGLTDVEREAKRITEAFAEMRENARLFNEELAREQEARNQQIADMQQQLADKQTMLERIEQMPQIPQEVLDSLADMGIKLPQGLMGNMAETLKEEIKKLIDEIARLQGLNADQTPIDMSEIDRAEQEARRALRERVRDSLDPYLRANLTPVQQQLLQLNDTFEKLRRDAHAAGVSMSEVDKAYAEAVKALRKQVMDQLQPYLDMADGLTPLQVQLRELDKRFEEMRTNAKELGIDMETVNRAEQAAREQIRQQFEDELKAFGGENPFVAQLDELRKKFEELTKNAIALGLGTDRVDAAYQQALANLQKQFQDGIQSYLDYGRGMSDIAVRFRDLNRFFDEQREAARALDEAQGFHGGGGPNEQLLDEAQAAAFRQLVDEFKASLQDLRDAGLRPTEIAVREMHDRFSQLREDAELLGLSVDELSRLEQQAIERLRGELDAQLDRYLLSDEEQQQRSLQEEFLGYLRDAFALYTYEPGTQEEPEPFPGARALEETFGDVKTASQELAQAFRDLRFAMDGTTPPPPPPGGPLPDGGTDLTPGEMVAEVLDFLKPLYEGRGMDDVPAEQRQAIDAASTQVALLLEQLRLGMTDDTTALQGALGNLVSLLQQSGIDIDGSLLALTQALGSGDIEGFLDELRDGVLGTTDGFGALIDILLSGGDLSLPDLMHQLASGTFDAIQAMLGLTEIPPELAETLKRIGLAYEAAQNQQRTSRQVERGGGDDANREAEQRQRDLDALLRQLEQFEDLQLSPAERELKKLNEQFDEMRENAARLGVSLDRVESAYQLAIADFWERLLGPLNDFLESLSLSELSTLTPQQRLEEAQARFQDLATRAMGGDLEAAQQLQAAAQQYLQEAQSFYASGQGYQDIFAMVNSVIQQILGTLAPGLLAPPSASGIGDIAAMLADTGWSFRDALTTAGIPFGAAAGDLYGAEPGETPSWLGATPEGAPELATDLSGMRETNRALLEEVRLTRQQEHVDAVDLQRRVDEQSEELREVRALLRRLTSTTQYGGRTQ